jgi:hypothetical protein
MNKEIAHFFWHGTLSKLEERCITSFVNNGFDVNIWSYTNIKVERATSRDASELLDESLLFKISQVIDGKETDKGSLAAFSDLFRYKLLSENDGWWIDTDCYCLKHSDDYFTLRKNGNCVIGIEDPSHIAGSSVLFLTKEFAKVLYDKSISILEKNNYKLNLWGEIGPILISEEVLRLNETSWLFPRYYFFPVLFRDNTWYFDKNKMQECTNMSMNSYCVHICTHSFNKYNIDKENPPIDTFLYQLMNDQFTSTQSQNPQHYQDLLQIDRIKLINDLYKSILNRPGDFNGLTKYVISGISIEKLKNIFLNSDEYKRRIN